MTRAGRWPLVAAIAAAVLVVAALLVSSLERYEEEVDVPLSGEAARDPVLAARRFLERMGVPARRVAGLRDMPSSKTVVILADTGRSRTISETRRIVEWIGRGGLVVAGVPHRAAGADDAVHDGLLEALGIRAVPRDADEPGPYEARLAFHEPDETLRIRQDGAFDVVRIKAREAAAPTAPGETRRTSGEDDGAGAVVVAEVGNGLAVVVSDLEFLRNRQIGDLDHAQVLWRLVHLRDEKPAGVWLVHGDSRPNLVATIVREGWRALLPAAALVVAALLRAGMRLGPVIPPSPLGRRGLAEHVDAVGAFLWRRRRSEVLVEAARRAVRERLAARHPSIARLERAEQARRLAESAGADAGDVEAALFGRWPEGAEAFTHVMRTLTQLRRTL